MKRFGKVRLQTTVVSLVVVVGLLAAACGSGDSEFVAGAGDLGHIHDLVLDDGGQLLVASHSGLYRIEAADRAVLVGTERHDLMAMAALDDGGLTAGGHPDLRAEEYRVEDRPPFLGLARSSNGGESWEVVDLLGDADFHALVPDGDGLFAAETSGRIWYLDAEGEWSQLGEVNARDLAIDPDDSDRQLAPDYEGSVWVSSDGAASWTRLRAGPSLLEVEWVDTTRILGADETGSIWATQRPEDPWVEIAVAPAGVETFYVDPSGSWWITVRGGAISRSDDQGSTWAQVYVPPTGS